MTAPVGRLVNRLDPDTGRGEYNIGEFCDRVRGLVEAVEAAAVEVSAVRAYGDMLTGLTTQAGIFDIPCEVADLTAPLGSVREVLLDALAGLSGLTGEVAAFQRRHAPSTLPAPGAHPASRPGSRAVSTPGSVAVPGTATPGGVPVPGTVSPGGVPAPGGVPVSGAAVGGGV